jgi:hypothetical protein
MVLGGFWVELMPFKWMTTTNLVTHNCSIMYICIRVCPHTSPVTVTGGVPSNNVGVVILATEKGKSSYMLQVMNSRVHLLLVYKMLNFSVESKLYSTTISSIT